MFNLLSKFIEIIASVFIAIGLVSVPDPDKIIVPVHKEEIVVSNPEPISIPTLVPIPVPVPAPKPVSKPVIRKQIPIPAPTPTPLPIMQPEPTPEPTPVPLPQPLPSPKVSRFAEDFKLSYKIGPETIKFIASGYRDNVSVRGRFKWWTVSRASSQIIAGKTLDALRLPENLSEEVIPVIFDNEISLNELNPFSTCGYNQHYFQFFLENINGNVEINSETLPQQFEVDCFLIK